MHVTLGLQEGAAQAQPHVVLLWPGTRDWMDAVWSMVGRPHPLPLRTVKHLLELNSVNCILHLLLRSLSVTSLRYLWFDILASNIKTIKKEEQECRERV